MDIGSIVLDAIARHPQSAIFLLCVAGILSAFGPCSAQRALGFVASTTHRKAHSTSFYYAAGIIAAGMVLLTSTAALRKLAETSHITSAVMAACCLTIGIVGLWRAEAHSCSAPERTTEMTALSTFALGFGSSLLVAPCCTPFLLFVAAYAPANMLLPYALSYSIGCAIPYLTSGVALHRLIERFATQTIQQALRIVSSTIALALGLLYLVEI